MCCAGATSLSCGWLSALEPGERPWAAKALARLAQDAPAFTLLLYPGSAGTVAAPEFWRSAPRRPRCTPTSAASRFPRWIWKAPSASRALRWALTGSRYLAYPPQVALPPPLHGLSATTPFASGGREWVLPLPLTPGDVDWQAPETVELDVVGAETALEALRRCPTCQTRHPWLRPRLREVPAVEAVPGWANRLFGRDVLTLPSPHDLLNDSCPRCAERVPGEEQAAMLAEWEAAGSMGNPQTPHGALTPGAWMSGSVRPSAAPAARWFPA